MRHTWIAKQASLCLILLSVVSAAPGAEAVCRGEKSYLKATIRETQESLEWAVENRPVDDDVERLCVDLETYEICDGRDVAALRGYRLSGVYDEGGEPSGAVLVAQGNAMAARVLNDEFPHYIDAGFDVFIYDFRGYGESEGAPSLRGMVDDYEQLLAGLRASTRYIGKPIVAHGISHGGILLANATNSYDENTYLILDAVPAKIPNFNLLFLIPIFGCPSHFDPLQNVTMLSNDLSRIVVISGNNDKLTTPREVRALVGAVQERSPKSGIYDGLAHPFSTKDDSQKRSAIYREVLQYIVGAANE